MSVPPPPGSSTSRAARDTSPWVNAWWDPVANFRTAPGLFSLCESVTPTGATSKLIIAESTTEREASLRVYRDTTIEGQVALPRTPVALTAYHHDASGVPNVAVAAAADIFVYRNLEPTLRYQLPPMDLDEAEVAAWRDLSDGAALFNELTRLRDANVQLATRSREFLACEGEDKFRLMQRARGVPLSDTTCITCLDKLAVRTGTVNAAGNAGSQPSMLVVGTESGHLLLLDGASLKSRMRVLLGDIPSFLDVSGSFEVEYRVTVVCRTGRVFAVKNGQLLATLIEVDSPVVGLARQGKKLVFATMGFGERGALQCYHHKGRKMWSRDFDCPVTAVCSLPPMSGRNENCVVAALADGRVITFKDSQIAVVFTVPDPVATLVCGVYGSEDNSLVMGTKSGGVAVRILRRNARLEPAPDSGVPPEQEVPLNVPKKTRLYVEQCARERQMSVELHRTFQRDLVRLRLRAAREYNDILEAPAAATDGSAVSAKGVAQVSCEILGGGPRFLLEVTLTNTGAHALDPCYMDVTCAKKNMYLMERPLHQLGRLQDGALVRISTAVLSLRPERPPDRLRIVVTGGDQMVIAAVVDMPISDLEEE